MAGYKNIDPFPTIQNQQQTFSTDKETGQVDNLDYVCEDGQAQDVVALDVIDYININIKNQTLDNWVKKLAHGATITIGGIDLYEVSKAITRCELKPEDAELLLYGPPSFPFGSRRGCLTAERVIKELNNRGLMIIKKRLNDFMYTIVGRRP